jgi:hypothetical protein
VGMSRRIGSSRTPQPAEIVSMLLAFADRTVSTPDIRSDLDSTTAETEARRQHAAELKKENTAWDEMKKKLGDARIQCKSAIDTKANKDLVSSPTCSR